MNSFLKTAILSGAVSAMTLAALPTANAGGRDWHPQHGGQQRQANDGDIAVADIPGLTDALLVVLAPQKDPEHVQANPYRKPRPRPVRDYYSEPAGLYVPSTSHDAIEPWGS